jgi:hypothetical protein
MALLRRRARTRQVPSRAITAAGRPIVVEGEKRAAAWFKSREDWQRRVWELYDDIGEVRQAARSMGEVFARVPWYAGVRPDPRGDVLPLLLDDDDEYRKQQEDLPEEYRYTVDEAQAAVDALAALSSPVGGASEIRRLIGVSLFVPGECFLVGETIPGATPAEDEQRWDVRSTEELEIDFGTQRQAEDGTSVPTYRLNDGLKKRVLPIDTVVIRIWRPHPRVQSWADSPMRAALGICEELLLLTKAIQSAAVSRAAGPGVWVLPNSARMGPSSTNNGDGDGNETRTDNVVGDIIEAMSEAIRDPGSASAQVPLIMFVNDDVYEKFSGTGPIQWSREVDRIAAEQRQELLGRFANAIDWPAELLLGKAGLNHWCVDETTEVLTADGWRTQDRLAVGDVVLTLNMDSGLSEWQPVEDIYRAAVTDEPMVEMVGRNHSSLTTPNHRWPTRALDGSTHRIVETADLRRTSRIVTGTPSGDQPTDPKYADDLVELVAWYWTEGSAYSAGGLCIAQSHGRNPRYVARIRAALTRLYGPAVVTLAGSDGPAWRERIQSNETSYGGPVTVFYLNAAAAAPVHAAAPGKRVSLGFIRALTPAQLVLFTATSEMGDGQHHRAGRSDIWQADPAMLDAYELALILQGRMVVRGDEGRRVGVWKQTTVQPVNAARAPTVNGARVHDVTYTGTIWCPVTENGTWLSRRDGKIAYSGNTAFMLRDEAFQSNAEPAIMLAVDAVTNWYLYSVLRAQGVDRPERFCIWYEPSGVVSDPDEGDKALKAGEQLLISWDRMRRDLGYSDDDKPSDEELRQRIAIQAFMRAPTTVGAIPGMLLPGGVPSDGQGPPPTPIDIGQTGGPPESAVLDAESFALPTGLEGLAETLAALDVSLMTQAHQRADVAMRRALERANARLRTLAQADRPTFDLVRRIETSSLMVAPALGSAVIDRLTGATEDEEGEDLLAGSFAAYMAWYDERLGRADQEMLAMLGRQGLVGAQAQQAERNLETARTESNAVMLAGLTTLARALLRDPTRRQVAGEDDGLLVPPGTVRSSLIRAGGGGTRATSFVTGDLVRGLWREAGIDFARYVWRYGDPSMRRSSFEPHYRLNGIAFASPDDDRLGNRSGWPGVSHFWPGDHAGCLCLVELTAPTRIA